MERREGARGLRGPFGGTLAIGPPRALRGRARLLRRDAAPPWRSIQSNLARSAQAWPRYALSAHRPCFFIRRL